MSALPGRALILVENLSVPFDRRVWQECHDPRATPAGRSTSSARWARSGTPRPTSSSTASRIHRYPLEAATGGPQGYLKEYGTALWHTHPAGRASRSARRSTWSTCATRRTCCSSSALRAEGAAAPGSSSTSTTSCPSSTSRASAAKQGLALPGDAPARVAAPTAPRTSSSPPTRATAPSPSGRGRVPVEDVFVVRSAPGRRAVPLRCRRAGAGARQGAPALLPRRHGPAGRRRLRDARARRRCATSAATTGTRSSSAPATRSTTSSRCPSASGSTTA